MSRLNRFEISGCELIEANQEAAKRFEKMGWAHFFRSFDGHHVEITKIFATSFEDDRVRIGGLCRVKRNVILRNSILYFI